MRRALLPTLFAVALVAAAPPPSPPVIAPLPSGTIDAAMLLPPAPAEGSAVAAQEMEAVHRIAATRTPAEFVAAGLDGKIKDVSIFNEAVGPGADLLTLPQTARLFAMVRAEEKRDVDVAKTLFARKRPWAVDTSLSACSTADAPLTSYPSGHTSMAFAMGAILARLIPARASAIMARAADYAHNRIICSGHFPGDIAAGEAFGLIIAERLMADPGFARQFVEAKMELAHSAH